MVWLDRVDTKPLSYHSTFSGRLIESCCKPEIGYFRNHILDFSPIKSTKVIVAAVNCPTTLTINLVLHSLLSFNEVSKDIFVFKAHEDIP